MSFLAWIEQTGLSVWVRESPTLWAFPFVLYLHTLGLGVVAGLSVAVNIWALKFSDRYPFAPFEPFYPAIWLGFTVNFVSGVLLLIAYPAKALTNPFFYLKLALIAGALVQVEWLRQRLLAGGGERAVVPLDPAMRLSAAAALVLWAGSILTGRLLAYTYNYLMASDYLRGF